MKVKNILLLCASIVCSILILVVATLVRTKLSAIYNNDIGGYSQLIAIPLIIFVAKLILDKADGVLKLKEILVLNFTSIRFYLAGIITCILVSIATIVFAKTQEIIIDSSFEFRFTMFNTFLIMLCVGFLEEVFFRGIIQQLFTTIFNKKYLSLIFTSIIFALIHTQIFSDSNGYISFISIFVFSIFIGLVFIKTNNIVACTMFHAAWNFTDTYFLEFGEKQCFFVSLNNEILIYYSIFFSIIFYLLMILLVIFYSKLFTLKSIFNK
jgi:membrane protease YdiL (CAAX protease family)